MRSFFEAKGQIVHSVFASPQVIEWFTEYDQRLSDIDNNKNYQQVAEYFKYISTKDPAIKSVFFVTFFETFRKCTTELIKSVFVVTFF